MGAEMMQFDHDTQPSRLAEEVKKNIKRSKINLLRLSQDVKIDHAKLVSFMEGETEFNRSKLLAIASKLGLSLQQIGKG